MLATKAFVQVPTVRFIKRFLRRRRNRNTEHRYILYVPTSWGQQITTIQGGVWRSALQRLKNKPLRVPEFLFILYYLLPAFQFDVLYI